MLATSGLVLVSANPGGSYNYGYNLNDASTGELQEQRETKVCNDQVVYDDNIKPTILASKSFVAEPIIASVTSGPIMNTEFVSSTPASILRSDFESSRIVAAAPLLETKIEAEPLIYAPRPKYAAPITVTAAPMLETKIVAEPLAYAARAEYAPLVKYAPRPEYLAASPAPLIMSKPQTPIVHVQAPTQIIKSAQLQSYGRLSTSHSHKSFVNHPQAPLKIAAVAAPQYYAAAPTAPQYYAAAPAAPEYYAPTVVAKEYHVAAPAAPEYHSAAPIAWQAAPAPIAVKIANPVVQANYGKIALQQAAVPLFAPSTQYAYRSSSPAKSYQYASQWKNYEQLAANQLHYSAASPQYYSTVYQPQFDYATAEQPCE